MLSLLAEDDVVDFQVCGKVVGEVDLDYDKFYDRVYSYRKASILKEVDVQHRDLVPTLRPYQRDAVRWAIMQETENPVAGGILGDEMGLGKTVEVLALILNRQRPSLASVEWMQPEAAPVGTWESVGHVQGEKEVGEEEYCKRCFSLRVQCTLESVIWRHNPEMMKSTIQGVVDTHCSNLKRKMKCSCLQRAALRNRLKVHYNNALAQYSGLKSLYPEQSSGACTTEAAFLCVCGHDDCYSKPKIQCTGCTRFQHSSCVSYDITDPFRGKYLCPQCWPNADKIPSKATLIVTPASISHQWLSEIQKHIRSDSLKVLFYPGTHKHGYSQPLGLANNDIIITTYEVLRTELNFVDTGQKRNLRHVTHMNNISPLLSIQFWRICLDEAQMVEGATTRAAEMVRKLDSLHRWCVTGTPIQTSVMDLYGLLQFLNGAEYTISRLVFQRTMYSPYLRGNMQPLVDTLAPVFWRTRKFYVLDQIHIPPQSEVIHLLKFSPVEDHFYQQLQIECSADMQQRFDKLQNGRYKCKYDPAIKLSQMDRQLLNVLLYPILSLRQV